jgi:hypothetical protein
MYTTFSSDSGYIDAMSCNENTDYGQAQYSGSKSLQCSIDGSIWDWDPIFELAEIPMPQGMTSLPHWFSLRHQIELRDWRRAHGHDDKFWALLSSDEDAPNNTEGCCPIRKPSPNEVKLMAWLAVACDVDGIMWYPWDFAGLLEWNSAGTEIRPVSDGRFGAAEKVGADIQKVAPILESLEFVKT